ncbi:MAG TPA: VIT1/CCC1 transporter family protein [Nitriliruptorales bacterium]|nr:VIT1/CCC1 transporter family protein [Nitriliruptorales bacterium]
MAEPLTPRQITRFRGFWADELRAARLYRELAELAADRRPIFLRLADTEQRHAAHWQELLRDAGVDDLSPPRPTVRDRLLLLLARRLGVQAVLPLVIRSEAADADRYRTVAHAPDSMSQEEVVHGRVLAAVGGVQAAGARIATAEGRHRTATGGALRAAVFGVNDGLVSNLSLVMGVAGGAGDERIVLLAGVAGLFAGALSMGAGEWISVRSQRELYAREIEVEREELARWPDEEQEELALIFQAKGMSEEEAHAVASRLMENPASALDTLAREELGVDPADLPSAWVAAAASFVSFAVGALIPVLPFLLAAGTAALVAAAALAAVSLFAVGGSLSIFTGRPALVSGARMVGVGALAATATYLVGTLFGVTLG